MGAKNDSSRYYKKSCLPAVGIREISDEQVRDYLSGHVGAEAGQGLHERLDERMRGSAHNPLHSLLAILQQRIPLSISSGPCLKVRCW
ncbi:MAG: hypothetical protein ACETWR_02750 [Anaerolineae bacterium]